MRATIMSAAFYAQPTTVNVFERGRRSRRARWRVRRCSAVGDDIRSRRKHRRHLFHRCPTFTTGCLWSIMHVLPKGKSLGTEQRLQAIFGLIFIDRHRLPFLRRNTLLQPIEQDSSNEWIILVTQQSKPTDEWLSVSDLLLTP